MPPFPTCTVDGTVLSTVGLVVYGKQAIDYRGHIIAEQATDSDYALMRCDKCGLLYSILQGGR